MKSVMISIQPKWTEKITHIIGQNGTKPIYEKSVEIRKTKPKITVPFKCYIYETKGLYKGSGGCLFNGRGKVIAEFICDRVSTYECEFVDDDCYEEISNITTDEDGEEYGFIEWSNDCDFSYEHIDLYEDSCVPYEELKKYMGLGFNKFYAWHISNLVIYDKPKELSNFIVERYPCLARLKRPPQSWCYVKGVEGE